MKFTRHSPKLNTRLYTRVVAWTLFCVITIGISVTLASKTAHASLFSFISSLLNSQHVSAKTQSLSSANSQTLALLQAAANTDPNPEKSLGSVPVEAGGVLVADIAASDVAANDAPVNTEISTYIVQSGDTISSVAKMFGVSVNTVLWANNLTGKSVLKAGQTLVILPISGITYTIKKGDTIKGIANKYKADVGDILAYNDITLSSVLVPGQTLLIPDAEVSLVEVSSHVSSGKGKKVLNEPLLDGWNWPSLPGYFTRPVDGGYKSQGLHGHNAVDLAGVPVGTPIHAAAAGTVIISRINGGWNGGYGNFVVISHTNGTQTLYAHMSRGTVSAGETVYQGQTIGYIGMTGLTTGPHLHFEVRGAQNPF